MRTILKPILVLSVAKSRLTLQYHELQHARLPCPPPSPQVCSNSCPLSWWCHPTISSFVTPFSSCPQSFPASESFPVSPPFSSGSQSIEASASVLPMKIQGWFLLDWLIWSPCSPRDSWESSLAQFESINYWSGNPFQGWPLLYCWPLQFLHYITLCCAFFNSPHHTFKYFIPVCVYCPSPLPRTRVLSEPDVLSCVFSISHTMPGTRQLYYLNKLKRGQVSAERNFGPGWT